MAATTSSVRGDTSRSTPSARTTATSWSNSSLISAIERSVGRGRQLRAPRPGGDRGAAPPARAPRPDRPDPAAAAIAEQRVGDAAHRRHDDGRAAAVAGARVAHDLDQAADGVGIGDRRAAEFLNDHPAILPYAACGRRRNGAVSDVLRAYWMSLDQPLLIFRGRVLSPKEFGANLARQLEARGTHGSTSDRLRSHPRPRRPSVEPSSDLPVAPCRRFRGPHLRRTRKMPSKPC